MREKQSIKKLKEALAASEAKYRELFENANIGVFQSTPDGKVIAVNPAFAQMFGYESPEDVLATVKNVATDVFADPQRRAEIIRLQAENPDVNTFENIYRRKDGSLFTGLLNTRHVNLINGQPNFWGFIQDITEQKQSEEKLRESERRFQALIEKAADLIMVSSAEGVVQFISPTVEKIIGYKPEEVVGRNFLEWVHPDDLPNVRRSLASGIQTPDTAPDSLIVRTRHKNGEWRIIEALGTNLLAESAIQGLVLNIRDVTEREQAERAIELKDELLRMSGIMAKLGGWEFDAETLQATWTDEVARIHDVDVSRSDANVELGLGFYTDVSRKILEKAIEEALALAKPYDLELEMISAKGVLKWVRTMGLPILDADQVVKVRGIFQDITERKQAEQVLRESEVRYRGLFEDTPVSLLEEDFSGAKQILDALRQQGVTDFETYLTLHPEVVAECAARIKVLDINKAAQRLFRAEKKEFLLTNLTRLLDKESVHSFILELASIARGYKKYEWEGINRTLTGELIHINLNWSATPGFEESLSKVIISIIDVTERKRAEAAFKESELRFQILAELAPVGIFRTDILGITNYVNPRWCEISRLNFEDALDNGWLKAVHPDDRESLAETWRKAALAQTASKAEYRFLHPDGSVAWVIGQAVPQKDANGGIIGYIGTITDITERKQTEERLQESEARFSKLFRSGPNALVLVQAFDGIVIEVNDSWPEFIGYSREETLGHTGADLNVYVDLNERQQITEIMQAQGDIRNFELGLRRKDGEARRASVSGESLEIDHQLCYLYIFEDITERKQVEKALRESEERYHQLFDLSPDAIVIHDGKTFLLANPAAAKIFGAANPQELIGKPILGVVHPDYFETVKERTKLLLEGKPVPAIVEKFIRLDGIVFDGNVISLPYSDKDTRGVLVILHDITQRKAAEAEINRHLSELEVLYENGLAISRLLEPKEIGQKLIETLSKKLAWHHASIRVIQPETGKLELLAYGHPGLNSIETEAEIARLNQLVTDLGKGLSGWVAKHGKPVRCAQVKKNRHYFETNPGIQSGLYVPIQAGGRTIGSIAVESEQEDAFSEQDQRLLTTIASQAAISIRNAQLFLMAQQELMAREQAELALLKAHAELEQRVTERTAEVQDLYNNAPCGYHSLDANGKIVLINKTELDWLGYESGNVIGRPVKDFLSKNSQTQFAKHFPAFKKAGVLKDQELEFVRKDGSTRLLLINASAIYDEKGAYKMSRSTTLDITQRKQIDEALRESEARLRRNRDELSAANIALEKAARMKDEFLASMSHELRTPLTGILGLSEALQLSTYGNLSEKQLKALRNIEYSGRHLLELINDILDLSKIEAGKFEIRMEQASLTDVCRASLQLAKGMAQQKHQNVSFSMNPDSIYLRTDARRLKQMLVNLLSNAVKFTPDGGSIGLNVQGDASEQRVKLTVWDTGIGIKTEDLKNLFKPFVQLDSSLSRQYSGTGLGLSLVQRMAELLGGTVEVESILAEGSRFTIILPWTVQDAESTDTTRRKTASAIATQFALAKEAGQTGHPALILVADDNEDILEMLSDFLEAGHFRVISTRSGKELLERAPELHPDIILINIQMPGMDGLETIRRVRAHADAQIVATPIIAITALAMPGDRELCLAAGANEYLSKPLQLVKLIAVIREILR